MKVKLSVNNLIAWSALLYLLFQNIIQAYIPLPDGFGYWDEATEIVLIVVAIFRLVSNGKAKKNYDAKIVVCTLAIIFIGLAGNIAFGYAYSVEAIFRDIINFMKFPMTFVCMRYLNLDKKLTKYSQGLPTLLKWIVYIILVLGVISVITDIGMSQTEIRHGIRSYMFLFTHPTYLVMFEMFVLAILIAYDRSNLRTDLAILATIILTMRTKGIALVAFYIFIKYAGKWMRSMKILYWGGAAVVIAFSGYSKIVEYASWSSSPRETLYKGGLQLMQQGFPLGSGFASFASHLSGKFYSSVYNFIHITDGWVSGKATNVLGDSGFPYYMGQFGVFGCILFIMIIWFIFKEIYDKNSRFNLGEIVLLGYILIGLTSEAVLVNNGTEFGIMLAVVAYAANENEKSEIECVRLYNNHIWEDKK